ncbi:MAG: pyridoxamine 5'-phosphate oxidase family protein [Candidatus Bathyarchaeota archaeon]|nr:MAG: pyridoxamine 5'-phosphate oxidase family protein [Candidatus Bathyarchaeota archaeon]
MTDDGVFVENGLAEMEQMLRRAEVGRIGLAHGSKPYVIPLNFLYHEGKIVFHCAWEGKKLASIEENPNCCFEVDTFVGSVSDHHETRCHLDYDSVLAYGRARVEKDVAEKTRLLQLFAEKYSEPYRKPTSEGGKRFSRSRASECCCVVIDVEELTGRRERTVGEKQEKTMWRHSFNPSF